MNCRVVTSATETREVLFRAGKHRHSDKMANVSHHEYRGVETELHVFLTSALHGDEWSASRPGRFTPDTPWKRGWVGPRAGLDTEVPLPGIGHRSSKSQSAPSDSYVV